jgi:hypothetical protein
MIEVRCRRCDRPDANRCSGWSPGMDRTRLCGTSCKLRSARARTRDSAPIQNRCDPCSPPLGRLFCACEPA